MTWGCKAENHPNGCGWARRVRYPRLGLEEWWCDLCERGGDVMATDAQTGHEMTWDARNPDDRAWLREFIGDNSTGLDFGAVSKALGCLPTKADVLAALDERDRLEGAR